MRWHRSHTAVAGVAVVAFVLALTPLPRLGVAGVMLAAANLTLRALHTREDAA